MSTPSIISGALEHVQVRLEQNPGLRVIRAHAHPVLAQRVALALGCEVVTSGMHEVGPIVVEVEARGKA